MSVQSASSKQGPDGTREKPERKTVTTKSIVVVGELLSTH
jgi:hypothetical protein